MSLSYNEKGQFRGSATIIFKLNKNAVAAVTKFNKAPIDGGKLTLLLELVLDPSKRSLASRITPNKPENPLKEKLQQKRQQLQKKAPAAQKAKPKAKKPKAKKVAKSAEELDQEMTDYFESK